MAANFLNPSDNKALISRLFQLMPDAQRRWGTMSAGQMLVHCADQLRVSRGEKRVTSLRVPGLLRPLLKWYFVTRLKQFKPNMKTMYELDAKGWPDAARELRHRPRHAHSAVVAGQLQPQRHQPPAVWAIVGAGVW